MQNLDKNRVTMRLNGVPWFCFDRRWFTTKTEKTKSRTPKQRAELRRLISQQKRDMRQTGWGM